MDPVITARHCEISAALRDHATTVIERIGSVADRPMETAVVFTIDAGVSSVELRLHVAHGEVFVATADGPDHRTALDRAEDKIRTQIARATGRARSGRQSAELKQV